MCTASFPAVASPPTVSAGSPAKPGFFLPVRVLSRLFRRRFLEELAASAPRRPAAVLRRGRGAASTRGRSPNGSRRCARANGSSTPSVPSPDRRRCSPICPATPIGWRSRTRRLLAFDERGVTFRWKDYRATGKTRYKAMTLSADEFIRRFLLHVLPSGFHRIRHYGLLANAGRREHLAQARELLHVVLAATEPPPTAAAPSPSCQPTFVCPHCGAAMSIVEIFARGATDPRPTHLASCSMNTGIGCVNATSALRRPLPIADGFALRRQKRASRPRVIAESGPASSPSRIGAMSAADSRGRSAPSRADCDPSNPHSGLASPNGSGACRGFLPCMLPQDRSFDVSCRCHGALCECLHRPTSLGAQSSSSSMKACRCLRLSPSPYSYPNASSHVARKGYDKRYCS